MSRRFKRCLLYAWAVESTQSFFPLPPQAPQTPIALTVKRRENALYLFGAAMRNHSTRASFTIRGLPQTTQAEVLKESRSVQVRNGEFGDDFKPYEVHLYRLRMDTAARRP